MAFIKWMDERENWVKIVLSILILDYTWDVYRLIKCIYAKNVSGIVISAVIIIFGWFWWVVDLITLIMGKGVLTFENVGK